MEKEIADVILKWLSKDEMASPYRVELDPTNKCNLMCLACVSRGKPIYSARNELTKREWLKIIREAIQLGAKDFNISGGGEPLCRLETTLAIMVEIKKHNLNGSLTTNGTLFTEKMIRKLVMIGWDEIRFSIDGPDAKTHDYLRGVQGAFNSAIESIKLFASLKKKLNQTKPKIYITPVITSQNFNKICEMIELAHDLEADLLVLQPFMSETLFDMQSDIEKRRQISKKLKLNSDQQEDFQKYLKKAKRLAEKYRIPTNFDFLEEKIMKETTDVIIQSDTKNLERPLNDILNQKIKDTKNLERPLNDILNQKINEKKKIEEEIKERLQENEMCIKQKNKEIAEIKNNNKKMKEVFKKELTNLKKVKKDIKKEAEKRLKHNEEEIKKIESQRMEIHKLKKILNQNDSILSIPCFLPWFLLRIHSQGTVEPCGGTSVRESVKQKSLREIWYGELFNKLRQQLISKKIPTCCKTCCPTTVCDIRIIRKALLEAARDNLGG
jgi:MoaA/NifB/PqqE/SkfB family radical SAM enzyme